MPEPIDGQDFAGPHPTCREFVTQLAAWGFTPRGDDHVHTVFRGPRGGTLRRPGPGRQGRPAGWRHTRPVLVRAAVSSHPGNAAEHRPRRWHCLPPQARRPRQRHLPRPGHPRRSRPTPRL